MTLKRGDRVLYTFYRWQIRGRHPKNIAVRKRGEYMSDCRHNSKHWRHPDSVQLSFVYFDGHKRVSRVPRVELERIDTGGRIVSENG